MKRGLLVLIAVVLATSLSACGDMAQYWLVIVNRSADSVIVVGTGTGWDPAAEESVKDPAFVVAAGVTSGEATTSIAVDPGKSGLPARTVTVFTPDCRRLATIKLDLGKGVVEIAADGSVTARTLSSVEQSLPETLRPTQSACGPVIP